MGGGRVSEKRRASFPRASGLLARTPTCIGAGQVVARIQLFDDVLVNLVPLALCVTPKKTQSFSKALTHKVKPHGG